jgi:hypothetical protein
MALAPLRGPGPSPASGRPRSAPSSAPASPPAPTPTEPPPSAEADEPAPDDADPTAKLFADGQACLAKWAPRLPLPCRVGLAVGDLADNMSASVICDWRLDAAVVTLDPTYYEKERRCEAFAAGRSDADLLEHGIVHELLHVLEQPLVGQLDEELEWVTGRSGILSAQLRGLYRDYRELWINRVAQLLIALDRSSGGWPPELETRR